MRSRRLAVLVLCGLALAMPARALVPTARAMMPTARGRPLALPLQRPEPLSDPAFDRFLAETGGRWSARADRLTGRLSLAWGAGIPWPAPAGPASPASTPDEHAAAAKAFVAAHGDLFRVPAAVTLEIDRDATLALEGGRRWHVELQALVDGVPVAGARVIFRIHSDRLVQFGASRIADGLASAPTRPRLEARDALAALIRELSRLHGESVSIAQVVEPARLVLVPREGRGGLEYPLAWSLAVRLVERRETWAAHVDALTGEVTGLVDANLYSCASPASPVGRAVGGVQVGPAEEQPIVERGLPDLFVTSGVTAPADRNGAFALAPGESTARLAGALVHAACVGCDAPPGALARNAAAVPDLSFGFGGVEERGDGRATPAERNAYYWLAIANRLALGSLDPSDLNGFFTDGQVAHVNLEDTCNGFASYRSIFYLRGNASCRNCAEVPDAVIHEWGHSIDLQSFPGPGLTGFDFARSEGLGDLLAILVTHESRFAPYFFRGDSAGLREADEIVSPTGVMTVAGVPTDCPAGGGPAGGEPHCEGQVFLQAHWHLGRLLRSRLGQSRGWHELERLVLLSIPISHVYLPDQTDSTYDALVFLDDDDADLSNGTPNGLEILQALDHHGMASVMPVGDSIACVPPAAPVLTSSLVTDPATLEPAASLSWTVTPGAIGHDVFRNDGLAGQAELRIASLDGAATSFRDESLAQGVTYRYRVAAWDLSGCRTDDSNLAIVAVPPRPRFDVASVALDDAQGDGDGTLERGEIAVLDVALDNVGTVATSSAIATLSTRHPGIAIRRAVAPLPDCAAGQRIASGPGAFEIEAARYGVACGESVAFTLEIETAEGCASVAIAVPIGGESSTVLFVDDLEGDFGWTRDALSADTATEGLWVREPPNPKWFRLQPGEDHTPAGAACFVTGNAASDTVEELMEDDVDGGCTSMTSPVLPARGRTGLVVSYWRRLHSFMESGDAFVAEVSNDGGANWRMLENVTRSAPSWVEASFDLDAILGAPADRLVIRFTACDGGADSFVEMLVDDLAIRERIPECGCALVSAPAAPALPLLATGRKDENGAEFSWPVSPLQPGQHYRLRRGTSPATLGDVVTPAGHAATSWDDRAAPDELYFYDLRIADCVGGEGPR